MQNIRPFVFFFALFSVMGCIPVCENVPPDEYIAKSVDVLGDYWAQNTRKTSQDVTIKRSEDANFPYVINIHVYGSQREAFLFQLYKIGDLTLAFAKPQAPPPNAEKAKQCFVMKLTATKTQIAIDTMVDPFFIENPWALRGTDIDKNQVKLHADPEQLAAFFKLHGKTKELFWSDERFLLYRR